MEPRIRDNMIQTKDVVLNYIYILILLFLLCDESETVRVHSETHLKEEL
jgi:hypothetical protein